MARVIEDLTGHYGGRSDRPKPRLADDVRRRAQRDVVRAAIEEVRVLLLDQRPGALRIVALPREQRVPSASEASNAAANP